MKKRDIVIDLPTYEEAFGDEYGYGKSDEYKEQELHIELTDLAKLSGTYIANDVCEEEYFLWTKTKVDEEGKNKVYGISNRYNDYYSHGHSYIFSNEYDAFLDYGVIRPKLHLTYEMFLKLQLEQEKKDQNNNEIELGEYPQDAINDFFMLDELSELYQKGKLEKTGRTWTFYRDLISYPTPPGEIEEMVPGTKFIPYPVYEPITYEEYTYEGRKFIRYIPLPEHEYRLADGSKSKYHTYFWIEVKPVTWLLDKTTCTLVSKKGLLSGVRFNNKPYDGIFEHTEMYKFLSENMLNDLLQSIVIKDKIMDVPDDVVSAFEDIMDEISPEDREAYLKAINELKQENNEAKSRK